MNKLCFIQNYRRVLVCFLFAISMGATARAEEAFTAYALSMPFPDAVYYTVNGGPSTIDGFPFIGNALTLKTDGTGKISGAGWLWIDYSNAPYSAYLVNVDGKISSNLANSTPQVRGLQPRWKWRGSPELDSIEIQRHPWDGSGISGQHWDRRKVNRDSDGQIAIWRAFSED